MRREICIGHLHFATKKAAKVHFRTILACHNVGDVLEGEALDDLLALIDFGISFHDEEEGGEEVVDDGYEEKGEEVVDEDPIPSDWVESVRVAAVQYGTKCFEVVDVEGSTQYISYLLLLRQGGTPHRQLVSHACRTAVAADLRSIKQRYFDATAQNGRARCQESGALCTWEHLVVDHRQPNTFSSIVERWVELRGLDADALALKTDDQNRMVFVDDKLTADFAEYHRERATLRIVRKDLNAGRASMGRTSRSSKDQPIGSDPKSTEVSPAPQLSLFENGSKKA